MISMDEAIDALLLTHDENDLLLRHRCPQLCACCGDKSKHRSDGHSYLGDKGAMNGQQNLIPGEGGFSALP